MAGNNIPTLQHLGEARAVLGEFRTYELAQVSMLDQPDKVADYNKRMDDSAKLVRDELAAYAALPANDRERALYAKVAADTDAYFRANTDLRAAVAAGDAAGARDVSDNKSRPARRQLFEDLKVLGVLQQQLLIDRRTGRCQCHPPHQRDRHHQLHGAAVAGRRRPGLHDLAHHPPAGPGRACHQVGGPRRPERHHARPPAPTRPGRCWPPPAK